MKKTVKQIKNFRYIFVLFLIQLCSVIAYGNEKPCPSEAIKLRLALGDC